MTLTGGVVEHREVVNLFHAVGGVGDAESEVEIELLQQFVAEEMSLNHSELTHRLVANGELYSVKTTAKQIMLLRLAVAVLITHTIKPNISDAFNLQDFKT